MIDDDYSLKHGVCVCVCVCVHACMVILGLYRIEMQWTKEGGEFVELFECSLLNIHKEFK